MISCVAWSHDEINDICNQTICKNQFLFTKKKNTKRDGDICGEKNNAP